MLNIVIVRHNPYLRWVAARNFASDLEGCKKAGFGEHISAAGQVQGKER
jgi:hypothetical protein